MRQKFNPEIWTVKRQKFNPEQWNNKSSVKSAIVPTFNGNFSKYDEVEIVLSRVEDARIDLTINYNDWLKLGFAFASEFGEYGRSFFHRISRFFHGYDKSLCNHQFDKCLKGKKSGVTIKSFFAAAYNAGINVKV